MLRVCLLTALVALSAGEQSPSAEWMPGVVARRAAGPPPASLPPIEPDAEIIGPITDPRPALDGNFQVPYGHRLAGVYRNDKPRLPENYVRYLREQGLTDEQIEHGAGLEGTRRVRTPHAIPAPAPGQVPLPGGLTLHLEPNEPEERPEERPEQRLPRPPLPADRYPAVQTVPPPSIDHLRSADAADARHNEVGVTATADRPTPAWRGLHKPAELRRGAEADVHPRLEELRRHHRRFKQRLDEQWKRQLQRHEQAVQRGRHSLVAGGGSPQVREEYHVRRLPGGGRSVSYSKSTTHSTTHTSRGGQLGLRQPRRQQRRKRQHQPTSGGRRHWGAPLVIGGGATGDQRGRSGDGALRDAIVES